MKTSAGFLLLTIAAAAAAQPARADLSIVQTTTIDAPGVKSMLSEIPQASRAPLLGMISPMLTGAPWITTTYLKGQRMRTDMGQTTTVINADSGNQFTLNRQTQAYSVGPYDPFQKAAGTMTCTITPTDQTQSMLGRTVRRYAVTMTSSVLPSSAIQGEIWAAPDLPTPPVPGFTDGTAAAMQAEMSKVKGMPLAYRLVYHNTPAGDITLTSYATQIREDTLTASTFTIPSSYHKGMTRTDTGMPSTGFPLGDGMPLDSMTAVTDDVATGKALPGSGQSLQARGGLGGANPMQALSSLGGSNPMQALGLGGGNPMQALGLGGGTNGAGALGGVSPAALQQLVAAFSGSGAGTGQGLVGGSASGLSGLSSLLGGGASGGESGLSGLLGGAGGESGLSGLLGGGNGASDLSSMLPSPQALQQLTSQMQSLLDENGD
ncbi:MAG: hypothetical protein JWQ02_3734 [Capsulimonas sp.]|nr:hypothetical protein [Capsulimonas sp.]